MLTVFLWVLLVLSVIVLIAIASPIRFGGSAGYRENGEGVRALGAWVSYVHPWVASFRYSSDGGRSQAVIFGFKKEWGDADNGGDFDAEDFDAEGVDIKESRDDTVSAGINTDNGGIDTNAGVDTDNSGINTDNADIDTDSADKEQKPRSIMSRIKSRIDSIKNHKAYRIISDAPLRKKSLRWLRRAAVSLVHMVSFEKFRLCARVGLRDPAALGKLYGYYSAVREAVEFRNCTAVDVAFEPVFTERCLDVEVEAAGRTTLSVLLWNVGAILLTFPYWRVYRVVIRE